MKKTIYIALIFSVLLSVFSIFSFADDTSRAGVSLMDEMESNLPNFNPSEYTGGRAMIVGAVEDLQDETCLYLYMYNPDKEDIRSGTINLTVNVTSDDGYNKSKSFSGIATYCVACTGDYLYVKLRVDLSSIKGILMTGTGYKRNYSWDQLMYKFFDSSSFYNNYLINFVLQKNSWTFSDSSSGLNVESSAEEVAQLDVHHTWYRSPYATEGKNTFDEVHTVYFSIPEQYAEYYEILYSVASTYTKKHTRPLIIGTSNFHKYGRNPENIAKYGDYANLMGAIKALNGFAILSEDYTESLYTDAEHNVNVIEIMSDFGYNVLKEDSLLSAVKVKINENIRPKYGSRYHLPFYFYLENPGVYEDYFHIPVEKVFEYIDDGEINYHLENSDMFDSSEYFGWSEKTINDKFQSIAYANQIQGDFKALCDTYGFDVALKFYLYRKSPDKLQELYEKYLGSSIQNMPEQANLLLCDDKVISDAKTMSNEDFSREYLVNIYDVSTVKKFIINNPNVILYRFDVCDYYSDEVVLCQQNEESYYISEVPGFEDDRFCFVTQYLYYDFRVIDVTFKNEDTFISLAVNSTPQNFGSDPGLEEDEPPLEWDPPTLRELFTAGKKGLTRILITVAIVILSVTFVVIGTRFVVKGISSGKSKNKKE